MLHSLRRRQTLASFDYQWADLPAGEATLSDRWFADNVHTILAREMLGVSEDWFRGRTVLDAGCGGGRWTVGLLRLGARVVAIDASAHAVEATRRETSALAPEPVGAGMLEVRQADLLDLPAELRARRFDLVYSFGVLHHTGDTYRAMRELAGLVGREGMLFLYLYGRATVTAARRVALSTARALLSVLPLRAKRQVLARLLPGRDLHQAFDLLSPLVNDRFDHATVERWLRELGFTDVTTTLDHTEIFMRASRGDGPAASLLPLPLRPYWFERYRRRR